jgi:hypothetical protein
MKRRPVVSDAMRSVGYLNGTLEIEFVSGDVHRYFDVPRPLYDEFVRAPSLGRFFNRWIRDRFRSEGPL